MPSREDLERAMSELQDQMDELDDQSDSKPSKKSVAGDLREKYEAELQSRKALERQVKDLQKNLAEYQGREADSTFESMGLTRGQRELFKRVNPDSPVTEETVSAFMREYELAAPAKEGEAPPPAQEDFRPTSVPQAGIPGQKVYTPAELIQLAATDPAAAQAAWASGRLDNAGIREGLGPDK